MEQSEVKVKGDPSRPLTLFFSVMSAKLFGYMSWLLALLFAPDTTFP